MSKTYIPTNLRQIVFERAQGCCEYCLIPEMLVLATHQIDHMIAEKHDEFSSPISRYTTAV